MLGLKEAQQALPDVRPGCKTGSASRTQDIVGSGQPEVSGRITGVVLADHVKNLDWQARKVVFEAKAGPEVLTEVRSRRRALLGL